jgi:hypothetical protein
MWVRRWQEQEARISVLQARATRLHEAVFRVPGLAEAGPREIRGAAVPVREFARVGKRRRAPDEMAYDRLPSKRKSRSG